jgi:AbrB family looped-hinge helix DNA binding protein
MLSVKVSAKHQIAVPSEARRQLGIKAGDRLDVQVSGDAIVLRRQADRPSERLRGIAEDRGWYGSDPVTFVRQLRDEWEDRASERERRLGG